MRNIGRRHDDNYLDRVKSTEEIRCPRSRLPNSAIEVSPARFGSTTVGSWSPVLLRLIVGYGFLMHGYAKWLRGPDAFAVVLHTVGVPLPHLFAWLTTVVELVGGVAVLIGAFIPIVSVPMAVVLFTAMFTIHLPYGFFSVKLVEVTSTWTKFGTVGYEIVLLYLAALGALALEGQVLCRSIGGVREGANLTIAVVRIAYRAMLDLHPDRNSMNSEPSHRVRARHRCFRGLLQLPGTRSHRQGAALRALSLSGRRGDVLGAPRVGSRLRHRRDGGSGFEVSRPDETVRELQRKGVSFLRDPRDEPWLWREARSGRPFRQRHLPVLGRRPSAGPAVEDSQRPGQPWSLLSPLSSWWVNVDPIDRFLADRIYEFNARATSCADGESFAAVRRDSSEAIVAGVSGYTWGRLLLRFQSLGGGASAR